MKAGYVRGKYSAAEFEQIVRAFANAGCSEVVVDVLPERSRLLERLLARMRPGDVFAAWSIKCVAESVETLATFVSLLDSRSIEFVSLSEAQATAGAAAQTSGKAGAALRKRKMPLVRIAASTGRAAAEASLKGASVGTAGRVAASRS